MKPSVSLIIPSIGRNSLERTIKSVLISNYPNLECIIVTDKSKLSKVLEILKKIGFGRVESTLIVTDKPLLPAEAKNLGISISKGRYITFIDDDDICYKEKFFVLSEYLEKNPEVFGVFGQYDTYSVEGKLRHTKSGGSDNVCFETIIKGNYIGSGSIMLRNTSDIMFPDLPYGFGEDWRLWLNLLGMGHKITFLPVLVYGWTQGCGFTKKPELNKIVNGTWFWKTLVKQNQEGAIKQWKK